MSYYRIKQYKSSLLKYQYVLQELTWFGWKTIKRYGRFNESDALRDGQILQRNGHQVECLI